MLDKISINTQSSIKINDSKIIYFDPFKIETENHDADYILITHDHYDHYDKDSINKIMKKDTILIIPDSIAPKVLGNFPAKNIIGVSPSEEYIIEGLKITTIPSYNINKPFHPKKNSYVGYIININDQDIYIAGDTDITEENKKVKCDIAIIPIGGTYTMDYKEAAELINIINPKIAIPTHYGTIVGEKDYADKFCKLLNKNINGVILLNK